MSEPQGMLATYADAPALIAVLRRLRAEGIANFEVFLPFPSEEIDELIPGPPTPIGWIILVAGLLGGAGAYFLQWYAARDYPLNVGGRPLHSWPSFVPVTFELTVLTAALVGVAALLIAARLPRLDYPTFARPEFRRASQDRFCLWLKTSRMGDDGERLRGLISPGAESVEEVRP